MQPQVQPGSAPSPLLPGADRRRSRPLTIPSFPRPGDLSVPASPLGTPAAALAASGQEQKEQEQQLGDGQQQQQLESTVAPYRLVELDAGSDKSSPAASAGPGSAGMSFRLMPEGFEPLAARPRYLEDSSSPDASFRGQNGLLGRRSSSGGAQASDSDSPDLSPAAAPEEEAAAALAPPTTPARTVFSRSHAAHRRVLSAVSENWAEEAGLSLAGGGGLSSPGVKDSGVFGSLVLRGSSQQGNQGSEGKSPSPPLPPLYPGPVDAAALPWPASPLKLWRPELQQQQQAPSRTPVAAAPSAGGGSGPSPEATLAPSGGSGKVLSALAGMQAAVAQRQRLLQPVHLPTPSAASDSAQQVLAPSRVSPLARNLSKELDREAAEPQFDADEEPDLGPSSGDEDDEGGENGGGPPLVDSYSSLGRVLAARQEQEQQADAQQRAEASALRSENARLKEEMARMRQELEELRRMQRAPGADTQASSPPVPAPEQARGASCVTGWLDGSCSPPSKAAPLPFAEARKMPRATSLGSAPAPGGTETSRYSILAKYLDPRHTPSRR